MVNDVELVPKAIGAPDEALHRMLKSLEAYPVKTVLDAPLALFSDFVLIEAQKPAAHPGAN